MSNPENHPGGRHFDARSSSTPPSVPGQTDPRPKSIRNGDEAFGRPLVVSIGLFTKKTEPRLMLTTDKGKVVDYPLTSELLKDLTPLFYSSQPPENPTIQIGESGAMSVVPSEILASRRGADELDRASNAAHNLALRDAPAPSSPPPPSTPPEEPMCAAEFNQIQQRAEYQRWLDRTSRAGSFPSEPIPATPSSPDLK